MKKVTSTFCLLLILWGAFSSNPMAAQSKADVFATTTPITWLGVDFSDMRFLGLLDVEASQLDDYAKSINSVIVQEPKKYDFTTTFDKQSVTPDLKYIEKLNAAMNTDKVVSSDAKDFDRYSKETISATVKSYNLKESGIGLVFIVEALSKTDEKSAIWVTFVDMKSGTVLLTERVIGKPAGFGFRNYWAGSIYSCLKQIKSKLYKEWKSQGSK